MQLICLFLPVTQKRLTKGKKTVILISNRFMNIMGGGIVKVEIKLSADIKEPYAVIYANAVTEEVQRAAEAFEMKGSVITAKENEKIVILDGAEIYMVRAENKEVFIYDRDKKYLSRKKLYELEYMLGENFMRISKTTIVNLKKIDSVEPAFNAMMYLVMKNGCKDYITRTYLMEFKKYLGI